MIMMRGEGGGGGGGGGDPSGLTLGLAPIGPVDLCMQKKKVNVRVRRIHKAVLS